MKFQNGVKTMKIVIIGAGSYVFTPTVIEDLIIKSRLQGCEIVLVDLNLESVQLLAEITKRIANDVGVRVNVTATTDRLKALPGADYVITTVAIQGAKRWQTDYDICKEEGIPFELTETGKLSGIAYGFRTITLMMDICRDMEKLCPGAKLLNVSNPLTKVHEAIHRYTNIESYGFCSVAQCGPVGYDKIARTLGIDYKDIDVISAGLNHFAWVISIKDRATGADLLPQYINKLNESSNTEDKVIMDWYNEYGGVVSPPIDHSGEYLPFHKDMHYYDSPPFHGSESERKQRFNEMKQMASGELDYKNVPHFLGNSWEHPGLMIGAMVLQASPWENETYLHINTLNVPNDGYLPQLPEGAIVEVPAYVEDGKLTCKKGIILPGNTLDITLNQCKVSGMVAQAAVEGNRELAFEIIDTDEAITYKTEAKRALDRILKAHEDILPQFSKL